MNATSLSSNSSSIDVGTASSPNERSVDLLFQRVVVVVNADFAFGAEAQTLAQPDPHVAAGLEAGQIVVGSMAYSNAGLAMTGSTLGFADGAEREVFFQLRVAEASQQRAGNARNETDPVAAVSSFRPSAGRIDRDAVRDGALGLRHRTARQVDAVAGFVPKSTKTESRPRKQREQIAVRIG